MCRLFLGKQFTYPGANGLLAKFTMMLGDGVYTNDPDKIKEMSTNTISLPTPDPPMGKSIDLIGDKK